MHFCIIVFQHGTPHLTLLNDANMVPDKYRDFVLVGQDGQSSETDVATDKTKGDRKQRIHFRLVGHDGIERIIVITRMLRFRHY